MAAAAPGGVLRGWLQQLRVAGTLCDVGVYEISPHTLRLVVTPADRQVPVPDDGAHTGLPIMRSLWLHYSDDPEAARRGDQFLWGTRHADRARHREGRDLARAVDLETMPIYVRAGAVIPMGPVREWTGQQSAAPIEFVVYPGDHGQGVFHEDDGATFDYRKGDFLKLGMNWNDSVRELTVLRSMQTGRSGAGRAFAARAAGTGVTKAITFDGRSVSIRLA